tara:strand:- start:67 stop:1314 length:1248 start_codon:yes stop_codon:yes gene_type:complete
MKKLILKIITFFFIIFLSYLSLALIFKTNPKDFFGIGYKTFKNLPIKLQVAIKLFVDQDYVNNLYNDYNTKHLPETQFLNIQFSKIKLDFVEQIKSEYAGLQKTFFVDIYKKKILITDKKGNIFFLNKKNIFEKKKKPSNIKNNLNLDYVLDVFIKDENLYISFVETKNGCETMNVSRAKINNNYLEFIKILNTEECGITIQGGRIQHIDILDNKGILITTGANIPDLPSKSAQNNNSIFGKILFIDDISGEVEIFSKGHRNPQGLIAKDNLILSTEHGPKGGDEINKIISGKNYGWPISSYGESYANDNLIYYKSHIENNFEEPIFSFIPSIGISEIISLPDSFSPKWQNNFLISSLNGRSLYRIKFNENFTKIVYKEKIFIGQRIRDLKYDPDLNAILLSLEDNGELGIIRSN